MQPNALTPGPSPEYGRGEPKPKDPSMRGANQYLTQARRRKAALLPRAAQLAGEGRTYQKALL